MTKKTTNNSETRVLCPNCGTEFEIPTQSSITVGITIGKDSNLGTIYPPVANKAQKNAKERIEALRAAGVDVSNLFAMQGANGGECIACNKDGKLSILDDNDPIFQYITTNGTVPNRKLFRRWVMAQVFYMLTVKDWRTGKPLGITKAIHRLGYDYQWKMLVNELNAQVKMEKHNDLENLNDRCRWFNNSVAVAMARHYIKELEKHVSSKTIKKCKGVPYRTIGGKNIFVDDTYTKLYGPMYTIAHKMMSAKSVSQLYAAVVEFDRKRIHLAWNTPQCPEWIDAYKGSGAYFTLQNMIRFHNCFLWDDYYHRYNKEESLQFIRTKASIYCDGEGWRMFGVLNKALKDNKIDVEQKMASWRK